MKRYLIFLALTAALQASEPDSLRVAELDSLAGLRRQAQLSTVTSLPDTFQLNINVASPAYLVMLPGIGEKTVQKIIDGRPYVDLVDLVVRKNGIGPKKAAHIEKYLVWEY